MVDQISEFVAEPGQSQDYVKQTSAVRLQNQVKSMSNKLVRSLQNQE